ncbi:MAG: matrixin family metalloprotease [Gammaproteobacteria bacterium]
MAPQDGTGGGAGRVPVGARARLRPQRGAALLRRTGATRRLGAGGNGAGCAQRIRRRRTGSKYHFQLCEFWQSGRGEGPGGHHGIRAAGTGRGSGTLRPGLPGRADVSDRAALPAVHPRQPPRFFSRGRYHPGCVPGAYHHPRETCRGPGRSNRPHRPTRLDFRRAKRTVPGYFRPGDPQSPDSYHRECSAVKSFRDLLAAAAVLSGIPALAFAYAFGTATPDGSSVQQNQVPGSGEPVIWYNPRQSLVLNFGGTYNDSAVVAMGEWNGIGTPMQWSVGKGAAQPCNSADHINSGGWRATTCDNAAFGDAIAVTKRSYEKIGDTWYLSDTDILADSAQLWSPYYTGAIRTDASGRRIQDFRRVFLHELGHALGLDHPDDAGQTVTAIMNSQISSIDSLQLDDINGIIALYSGVDATTSNSASQSSSSNGGGGAVWAMPVLLFLHLAMRRFRRRVPGEA